MNQSDTALYTRFMMTTIAELCTLILFLGRDNCDSSNPLLVQVVIVQPSYMGLTLIVFVVFNFIDNFFLDFPTAEEVA